MTKRLLLLSLAAAVLGTGCIITTSGKSSGDISFTWSFGGASCNQVPQVASVRVTIPGETLQNAGVFPCLVSGAPGVTLHDFAGGSYAFTVDGLDVGGRVLFTKSGTVVVNGNVTVNVSLDAAAGAPSSASMTWTFPPNSVSANPTCAQAGVDYVDVSFDGAAPVRYPCADGQTAAGAQSPSLTPGAHSVGLTAVTASSYPLYSRQGTLTVQAGVVTSNAFPLQWAVGAAELGWTLSSGGVNVTCAQAGVTDVYVNFRDASGTWVYGDAGDRQPCNSVTVSYDYLLPGTYAVYVAGVDPQNRTYEPANLQALPSVTVQAGNFTPTPINLALVRK